MAKTPICGMNVEERSLKYISENGGRTFYFCSSHCKQEFDKSPEKYRLQILANISFSFFPRSFVEVNDSRLIDQRQHIIKASSSTNLCLDIDSSLPRYEKKLSTATNCDLLQTANDFFHYDTIRPRLVMKVTNERLNHQLIPIVWLSSLG